MKPLSTGLPGTERGGLMIREMGSGDLEMVLEIERSSFPAPWTRRLFEETLSSKISLAFVLEEEGILLGYLVLYTVEDEAHILNVALAPQFRGKGYGTALLSGIVTFVSGKGVRQFFLEVREGNRKAINLYTRHGFETIGKRRRYYTETNEDALVMRLVAAT